MQVPSCGKALLEQKRELQPVKKFPAFCGAPISLPRSQQAAHNTRGADKSLAFQRKQATGMKKCIYSTYSP
jgi:hypothetical protein